MGIVYDGDAEEKKLYEAYGLIAYGKINRYVWTIHNNKEDKCIISLRISDNSGNNLVDMTLGNLCIMKEVFDGTINNFLYWISQEKPNAEQIEKQIQESLCKSDCLFNHRITSLKIRNKRREREIQRAEETAKKEKEMLAQLDSYCTENNYIMYFSGFDCAILNPLNGDVRDTLKSVIERKKYEMVRSYIDFAEHYPGNPDLRVVCQGDLDEVISYITRLQKKKKRAR